MRNDIQKIRTSSEYDYNSGQVFDYDYPRNLFQLAIHRLFDEIKNKTNRIKTSHIKSGLTDLRGDHEKAISMVRSLYERARRFQSVNESDFKYCLEVLEKSFEYTSKVEWTYLKGSPTDWLLAWFPDNLEIAKAQTDTDYPALAKFVIMQWHISNKLKFPIQTDQQSDAQKIEIFELQEILETRFRNRKNENSRVKNH